MKMIRHENEFVQMERFAALCEEILEKEPRPRFRTK